MSLQSTDPIADLLTRIRNAALVGKNEIRVPSSKLKEVVAKELVKANYIESVKVESAKPRDILVVKIAKDGEAARFNELTRMSKPGRRMYVGVEEIPRIKSGRGMVLLSASKGVMNGVEAKKQRVGGVLLLNVWSSVLQKKTIKNKLSTESLFFIVDYLFYYYRQIILENNLWQKVAL